MEVILEKRKLLPQLALNLCNHCDAVIVGSGAVWLTHANTRLPNDIDVIVPPSSWQKAASIVGSGAKTNSWGGLRVKNDRGFDMDIWAANLSNYFLQLPTNRPRFAVSPMRDLILQAHPR